MLFIFWPAEQMKQIRETLAHINITEKYRSDVDNQNSTDPSLMVTTVKTGLWKERSSKDLKNYLSERGVDMMEVNSEEYVQEILGAKNEAPKSSANFLRPNDRDLSAGGFKEIQNQSRQVISQEALLAQTENNIISDSSESSSVETELVNLVKINQSHSLEMLDLSSHVASLRTTISSSISETLVTTVNQSAQDPHYVESSQKSSILTKFDLAVSSSVIDSSVGTSAASVALESISSGLISSVAGLIKDQSASKLQESESSQPSRVVVHSKTSKIYEVDALIYNPLKLSKPDSILVEYIEDNQLSIYIPAALIENVNGTYLSQDHLEVWFDRFEVKPQAGYGNISHQFGVGLGSKPWVVDFLQNDSTCKLSVTSKRKGDLVEIRISNLPLDLRAWNIVFSKAVKEGKNWVQGQLLSTVEDFTWGDPLKLIPIRPKVPADASE